MGKYIKRILEYTVHDFGKYPSTYFCEVRPDYLEKWCWTGDFPLKYNITIRDGLGYRSTYSVEIKKLPDEEYYNNYDPIMGYVASKSSDLTKWLEGVRVFSYHYRHGKNNIDIDFSAMSSEAERMKLAAGVALFVFLAPHRQYKLGKKGSSHFNAWMQDWNTATCRERDVRQSELGMSISALRHCY